MAGLTHLVDSDVLIDALRGPGPGLARRMLAHDGRMAVSAVSVSELTYGALRSSRPDDALEALEGLLDAFVVIELDQGVGRVAGAVRRELAGRGTPIGPYDVLIAAQARAEGLVVATRSVREFRRVKGLEVESWR